MEGVALASGLQLGATNQLASSPPVLYFSGLVLQILEGRPVAASTRPLGVELLRQPTVRKLAVAAKSRRQLQANAWLSTANASTPLHYDTSDNVFVQLHGHKRLWLLPPRYAAGPLQADH